MNLKIQPQLASAFLHFRCMAAEAVNPDIVKGPYCKGPTDSEDPHAEQLVFIN